MKAQKAIGNLYFSLCSIMLMILMTLTSSTVFADPCFDRKSRGIRCERQSQTKPRPQVQRDSRPVPQPVQWTPPRNPPSRRRAELTQVNFNGR